MKIESSEFEPVFLMKIGTEKSLQMITDLSLAEKFITSTGKLKNTADYFFLKSWTHLTQSAKKLKNWNAKLMSWNSKSRRRSTTR